MKKILFFILFAFLPLSSFAYTIGQQLTIVNSTDKNMTITIEKVNNQAEVTRSIPAHSTTSIYTENGDNSGLLGQYASAAFQARDTDNRHLYVLGEIYFFVENFNHKYSFLRWLLTKSGIQVTPSSSCQGAGDGTIFQNQIVINGTPPAEDDGKWSPWLRVPNVCNFH